MGFSFFSSGSYRNTESYLTKLLHLNFEQILAKSGERGVQALAGATPIDTSLAAHSWDYAVNGSFSSFEIIWFNTDIEGGFPVALMLRYGHGTGTGGYVQGRNFISPAIQPVFKQIEADIRKAVASIR